jgi:hypothetical protein
MARPTRSAVAGIVEPSKYRRDLWTGRIAIDTRLSFDGRIKEKSTDEK